MDGMMGGRVASLFSLGGATALTGAAKEGAASRAPARVRRLGFMVNVDDLGRLWWISGDDERGSCVVMLERGSRPT